MLWVYRHNSRHADWPTVILRFMETRWKAPALSTRHLISWIKLNFMIDKNKKIWWIYRTDHIQAIDSMPTTVLEGPLGSWAPRLKSIGKSGTACSCLAPILITLTTARILFQGRIGAMLVFCVVWACCSDLSKDLCFYLNHWIISYETCELATIV